MFFSPLLMFQLDILRSDLPFLKSTASSVHEEALRIRSFFGMLDADSINAPSDRLVRLKGTLGTHVTTHLNGELKNRLSCAGTHYLGLIEQAIQTARLEKEDLNGSNSTEEYNTLITDLENFHEETNGFLYETYRLIDDIVKDLQSLRRVISQIIRRNNIENNHSSNPPPPAFFTPPQEAYDGPPANFKHTRTRSL